MFYQASYLKLGCLCAKVTCQGSLGIAIVILHVQSYTIKMHLRRVGIEIRAISNVPKSYYAVITEY
jgi:hypothetical protein